MLLLAVLQVTGDLSYEHKQRPCKRDLISGTRICFRSDSKLKKISFWFFKVYGLAREIYGVEVVFLVASRTTVLHCTRGLLVVNTIPITFIDFALA